MHTCHSHKAANINGWSCRPTCFDIVAAYNRILPGKLIRRGSGWEGPCPICNGTDRFVVNRDGVIWCRNCQPDSSERGKLAFKAIFNTLEIGFTQLKSEGKKPQILIRPQKSENRPKKIAYAKGLYEKAVPIKDTKAVDYLIGRGITEISDSLRFGKLKHSDFKFKRYPCLISKVINTRTGELIGVHRTYFEMKGNLRKRHAGCPKGGGILVSGQLESKNIIVAEGLEDALSIKQASNFDGAIWATCGTAFMKSFQIPDAARFIIIAADSDDPGKKAANAISETAKERKMHGRIVFTPGNSGDWNDLLVAGKQDFIRRKMRINQN